MIFLSIDQFSKTRLVKAAFIVSLFLTLTACENKKDANQDRSQISVTPKTPLETKVDDNDIDNADEPQIPKPRMVVKLPSVLSARYSSSGNYIITNDQIKDGALTDISVYQTSDGQLVLKKYFENKTYPNLKYRILKVEVLEASSRIAVATNDLGTISGATSKIYTDLFIFDLKTGQELNHYRLHINGNYQVTDIFFDEFNNRTITIASGIAQHEIDNSTGKKTVLELKSVRDTLIPSNNGLYAIHSDIGEDGKTVNELYSVDHEMKPIAVESIKGMSLTTASLIQNHILVLSWNYEKLLYGPKWFIDLRSGKVFFNTATGEEFLYAITSNTKEFILRSTAGTNYFYFLSLDTMKIEKRSDPQDANSSSWLDSGLNENFIVSIGDDANLWLFSKNNLKPIEPKIQLPNKCAKHAYYTLHSYARSAFCLNSAELIWWTW
jgi:hypothetical protein